MAQLDLKIKSNINQVETELKNLTRDRSMNLKIKTTGDNLSSLLTHLEMAEASARDTSAAIRNIGKGGGGTSGPKQATKELTELNKAYNDILAAQKRISSTQKGYDKLFKGRNRDRVVETDFDAAKLAELKKYETQLASLSAKSRNGTFGEPDLTAFNSLKAHLDTTLGEIQMRKAKIEAELESIKIRDNDRAGFDKIGNRLTEYYGKYENQLTKNIALHNKWLTLMNKANNGSFASLAEANREFAAFRTECRAAGIEIEGFGTKLEKTFGTRIRSALSGYGVFALEGAAQDIVQNVLEFDKAYTELKKVTSATESEYAAFVENAKKRSVELKSGLADTVSATASFSRLGYDIPQAETLAKTAIVYNNVGDEIENIDDATTSIISAMQGFNIEAENSMSIADKFNEVKISCLLAQ